MANEKRLIDANALQRKICGAKCGCEYEDCGCEGDCVFDCFISNAPTVDAVEVVHGRWMKTKEPLGWQEVDVVECSICHESWLGDEDDSFDYSEHWHYCPNCGAKMDGERKDNA